MKFIVHTWLIAVFVALAALPLPAQQAGGRVTVTGKVSALAAVSPGSAARVLKGDARVSAEAAGVQGLILSLSGSRGGVIEVEVPVQLRSNAEFALAASCVTRGATLSALSVVEVGKEGPLVYPGAAGRLQVVPAFEGRPGTRAQRRGRPDLSSPAAILNGPRISMGGPLDSPANMIEVVLRVVLTAPDSESGWHAELNVSAACCAGLEQPAPSAVG